MTHPTHTIRTVHDFLKVPASSRAVCLLEFGHWLETMGKIATMMDGIPVRLPDAYVWIDDGLHTASVTITDGERVINVADGVMRGFAAPMDPA